jgi:hypothetical protein
MLEVLSVHPAQENATSGPQITMGKKSQTRSTLGNTYLEKPHKIASPCKSHAAVMK